MASPTASPFPPTAMWPGRAALWRPAHRPPGMPFAAPRAPAPTGYWLVARTVGTLVLGGGEIRVCTGGRDAIKISLIAASVSGVVVPPAGEDGGGGALGGTWVFAATAWFTDAATARRSYLNFCFRLERPEDGPRLREAWGALAAAAERARSLSPLVEVLPPPAAAPSAPVPAPSAPAPASLVTVQALSEGGGGSSGGGGGGGGGVAPGGLAGGGAGTASDAHAATAVGGPTPPTAPAEQAPLPLTLIEEAVDEEDEGALAERILDLLADPTFEALLERVDAVWGRVVAGVNGV